MTQGSEVERVARQRLRALRQARGWSLDELGRRANMDPSTISRLETGQRRMAVDQLATLAAALDTTVDELLAEKGSNDIVIRPRRDRTGGTTFWRLTREDDPGERFVVKMLLPERKRLPEPRTHPGRDWFYVLAGTVRLQLGDRDILVPTGQAASFETMTPHSIGSHEGPAEIISIMDHRGERAHLHD